MKDYLLIDKKEYLRMNEVRERFGDDYAIGFAFDLLDNAFEKSEKQKKEKEKVFECYSIGLSNFLTKRGFQIIGTRPNTKNPNWDVWLFGHFHADRMERPHVEQYFKAIEDLEEIWKRWNDPNYLLPTYFRKSPNFDKGKTE